MNHHRKYEPIKESRDWYFVEYFPPEYDRKFAMLNLIIMENASQEDIAVVMEKELELFLKRYPIPIMVSSFDKKGDLNNLSQIRGSNHLIGFYDAAGQILFYWKLMKDNEIPDIGLDQQFVDELYSNLVYRTHEELNIERVKKRRKIEMGWFIFFIWLVIIPAIIAILEYYSNLLSLIALIYSLYQATKKGLELMGKWPKSKKAKDKDQIEQLKNHYYYHCQRNPEGFRKLMIENFERNNISEVNKEAELLKNNRAM